MPRQKVESVADSQLTPTVGVAEIESIVQKAVAAATAVIKYEYEKLLKDLESRIILLEERLEAVSDAVKNTSEQRETTEQADVHQLTSDVSAIRKDAREAVLIANDAEQYNRRQNLRIKGLAVQPSDDCRKVVVDFIRNSMGLTVEETDIEAAHVLPTRTSASGSSSPHSTLPKRTGTAQREPIVIVRFRNRDVRDSVIRKRRQLKAQTVLLLRI